MRLDGLATILFLTVMASGCQTPETTNASKPYQGFSESQQDSQYFSAELDKAGKSLAQGLIDSCVSINQANALEACFRQKTAAAFETSGTGLKACEDVQPFSKYAECIGMGSVAEHLRQKISSIHRPDMMLADWRTPENYFKRLMKGEILDITDKCLDGPLGEFDHCTRAQLAQFTSVSDRYLHKCDAIADSEKYGNCLGEAVGLEFLQQAADRLGARST